MRHLAIRRPVAALLLVLGACSNATTAPRQPPPTCMFANPVVSGADPWVVQRDGWYYFVQSRNETIWVSKSRKLTEINANAVGVWTAPATGWNRDNVWAPELHYLDGKWYLYYAAGPTGPTNAEFVNQRSFVLESVSDDPQGAYIDKGMLYTGNDLATGSENTWAIDLTVGTINGQRYAVWSGWEVNNPSNHRVPQHLYIATMSNPWTISSNRAKISSPVEPWERGTELDLQEGPEFLHNGASTFIIYSTRESWLPAYKLGQLRLNAPTADPLQPGSWTKSGPVFAGTTDVYGAGHAGFATSPDGTEQWILYHSKTLTTPGWNDRVIRMQKFTWKADGSPNFGLPSPAGQLLPLPSGECTQTLGVLELDALDPGLAHAA